MNTQRKRLIEYLRQRHAANERFARLTATMGAFRQVLTHHYRGQTPPAWLITESLSDPAVMLGLRPGGPQ